MRTYSRIKDDGKNERWWETVQRVVEGTYTLKELDRLTSIRMESMKGKSHPRHVREDFHDEVSTTSRGLWIMGTPVTEEKGLWYLNNEIAFVSTSTIKEDYSKPFCFLMDF